MVQKQYQEQKRKWDLWKDSVTQLRRKTQHLLSQEHSPKWLLDLQTLNLIIVSKWFQIVERKDLRNKR